MRKFIISDLHGNGNVYNSIMAYLEKIYEQEDIILYINGDLIDRGYASYDMLIDIYDRIVNKKGFPIEYLAGNHELLMYQTSLERKNGCWPKDSLWFDNGGSLTAYSLEDNLNVEDEEKVIHFISNLRIYHKFKEVMDNKQIVLVHAMCPKRVEDVCSLRVKDDTYDIQNMVWIRKEDPYTGIRFNIGNPNYFSIIGHTPVASATGYEYYPKDNVFNIDGGNAAYAKGILTYEHTPLVEIDSINNRLIILTFNNKNEIICGNYFSKGISTPMTDIELDNYRTFLGQHVKIIKLVYEPEFREMVPEEWI